MKKYGFAICLFAVSVMSCERVTRENTGDNNVSVTLPEVAGILSSLPVGIGQIQEVYDAVSASSGNGYDEEYMMTDLFVSPGAGVGDKNTKSPDAVQKTYDVPLRDLFREYARLGTKSAGGVSVEEYLEALEHSDVQIYWPYCGNWDHQSYPVITFDPEDGSETNTGYRMIVGEDGERSVEEIYVDEAYARNHPVWVVNRNDDSGHTSLEMMRRQDPEWGSGQGGEIIVGKTKAPQSDDLKTLILKEFTMNRNYDCWFAGASEFFVKCGSVEDFTAGTEAELRLYNPSITDFMIVVKRDQVGESQPFNAVLVSDWTSQLQNCAFMITEDDGGERNTWKTTAIVKVNSKSYGIELEIPFRSRDDIVWRGQLSSSYFDKYADLTGHFGDVEIKFDIMTR